MKHVQFIICAVALTIQLIVDREMAVLICKPVVLASRGELS